MESVVAEPFSSSSHESLTRDTKNSDLFYLHQE